MARELPFFSDELLDKKQCCLLEEGQEGQWPGNILLCERWKTGVMGERSSEDDGTGDWGQQVDVLEWGWSGGRILSDERKLLGVTWQLMIGWKCAAWGRLRWTLIPPGTRENTGRPGAETPHAVTRTMSMGHGATAGPWRCGPGYSGWTVGIPSVWIHFTGEGLVF